MDEFATVGGDGDYHSPVIFGCPELLRMARYANFCLCIFRILSALLPLDILYQHPDWLVLLRPSHRTPTLTEGGVQDAREYAAAVQTERQFLGRRTHGRNKKAILPRRYLRRIQARLRTLTPLSAHCRYTAARIDVAARRRTSDPR